MANVLAVVGLILVIVIVGAVLKVNSDPLTGGESRRKSYYENIVKPAQKIAFERRASERRSAMIESIKEIWQPKIDRENRRAAAAARRAERKMNRGKPNTGAAASVARHDRESRRLTGLKNKEVSHTTRAWDGAVAGNRNAQKIMGRVHPRTGHTTGGIGRTGHRPADHTPKSRQPKAKKSGGISWQKIIMGNPKPKRRRR